MKKLFHGDVVDILIYIAVFLAPFNTLRFRFMYLTVSDLLLIILYPLLMLKIKKTNNYLGETNQPEIKQLTNNWFFGCCLVIMGFLLSSIVSQNVSIKEFVSVSLQYIFVFIYIPVILIHFKDQDYAMLMKAYLYGMVAVVLIGALVEFFFPSLYLQLIQSGIFIGKIRFGSFMGTNNLVKTIAMCVPMVILLHYNKKLSNISSIVIISTFSIATLKASSIGGTFAVGLAIVLSLLIIRDARIKRMFLVLGIISFMILSIMIATQTINTNLFVSRVIDSVLVGDLEEAGSFSYKKQLMISALRFIAKNPFFGLGLGGYMSIGQSDQTVHNSYLLMWVEGGLLSFIGLTTILLSSALFAKRFIKIHDTKDTALIALIFIVVLAFNLITGTHIYQRFRIIPLVLILFAVPNLKKIPT